MNDQPRQVLCDLLERYPDLAEDRSRCSELLYQLCSSHRGEVALLITAHEEQIPVKLTKKTELSIPEVLMPQLIKELREGRHLTEDAAHWAVSSWALALKVVPVPESQSSPWSPQVVIHSVITRHPTWRFFALAILALLLVGKYVQVIQWFVVDGAEVKDKSTGLVWARCSVGQSWDGSTCTGSIKYMNYNEAMKYAENQNSWRLPDKEELYSLINKERNNPAIDIEIFPNTPSVFYWSSSSYEDDSNYAWLVSFGDGYIGNFSRYNSGAARLVKVDSVI